MDTTQESLRAYTQKLPNKQKQLLVHLNHEIRQTGQHISAPQLASLTHGDFKYGSTQVVFQPEGLRIYPLQLTPHTSDLLRAVRGTAPSHQRVFLNKTTEKPHSEGWISGILTVAKARMLINNIRKQE